MLYLQCGKATAVFVRSKHRDIVAKVRKCGSRGFDLLFPVPYLNCIFTVVRARTSTGRGNFFVFSGSCSQKQGMWYHMIRNVGFVVFWGTLLRPTAGAVVLIRKSTTLQNVTWLCASMQEESCAISLWSSTATSAVNIA